MMVGFLLKEDDRGSGSERGSVMLKRINPVVLVLAMVPPGEKQSEVVTEASLGNLDTYTDLKYPWSVKSEK